MSITDELREYAAHAIERSDYIAGLTFDLDRIADRIDAEHERELCETGEDIVRDVRREWVRLPVDADGVPIHIGDVMEWCDSGETLEVIGIGDATLFYIDHESDRTYAEWTAAGNKRHHHAPTVEDVLREFASDIADVLGGDDFRLDDSDELFAEYAAKLRLAGDE